MACGALLDGTDPVRIGLPLDGWDLAVVDAEGNPVAEGESGELIIGGVGLARYLDPEKDAEKYAPMPTLGWDRAYRSGDVVRNDPLGLVFAGRADDQIKLGGRRIELGEIDEQLLRLPGVRQAAAAVRSTKSGNKLLVGYLTVDDDLRRHDRAGAPQDATPRRARAAARRRRRAADPHQRQGRPRRPALAAAQDRRRRPVGLNDDPAVARRHLGRRARRRRDQPQGRLLRLRRRLADGRAGRQPHPRALPRDRGRRRLRQPEHRRPRRRPARARQQPGGRATATSRRCRSRPRPDSCSPSSRSAPSPACAG